MAKESLDSGSFFASLYPMEHTLFLINPWIYDFAAYDLWSKPLGLLTLAAGLRKAGYGVRLLDCMDAHHPGMERDSVLRRPVRRPYGTGKFWREKAPSPSGLKHIPRSYSRYGISRELFLRALRTPPKPAAVLVTSLMTYWYPGVKEVISLVKDLHPEVPVILGGIYARLCTEHARETSGADVVVAEEDDPAFSSLLGLLRERGLTGNGEVTEPQDTPFPAFDLFPKLDYICLSTSSGCPYKCNYCASRFLHPRFRQRNPVSVLEEILHWHKEFGVRDFAFYDDALLVRPESRMAPLMEELIRLRLDLRFHTPNALHVREITADTADLLYRSGFRTIRLGLETSDMALHDQLDGKVSEGEFESAVQHLHKAGYAKKDIGAYILAGLPDQSVESVLETIRFSDGSGAMPYLAEYSPIPRTALWKRAVECSEYDLAAEPLFHNNTLWPCWDNDRRARVPELKRMVREIRRQQDPGEEQGGT